MSKPPYESIPLERFQEVFKDTSTEVSSVALGGKIVSFSDEFFAEASNLLKVHPSVSMKGQFGPKGALYDGWETRRHNAPDHDWVIIRLGPPSNILTGFDIDTANFTGNEGPAADVWGLKLEGDEKEVERQEKGLLGDDPRWELLLPEVPLGPNSRHLFKIEPTKKVYSHVKLSMIPDGGFGRFRAYGWPQAPSTSERVDLAYALNGGRIVAQSDQHFGIASNLLLPGRGFDMGDGWECKRSRTEGNNEWTVVRLGDAGYIDNVEIDTAYHMGNFPVYAELHAINCSDNVPALDSPDWVSILPKMKQGPHRQHFYPVQNAFGKVFTHVKLTIWPDGGLKRLRIFGYRASTYSSTSLPVTHTANPIPQLEALPLTYEAFLPYGRVAQAYSVPTAAPRWVPKTTANQGTAAKYHKMALVEDDYKKDGSENHRTIISVMTAQPKVQTVDVWDIVQLEKHPRTTQTFVPLGAAQGQGSAAQDGSYVVTVALSDASGQPDLSTMRSFLVLPSQSVTYGRDVWHHGTLTADSPLTYAAIESVAPPLPEADIDFYKPGNTIAQITLPKLPSGSRSVLKNAVTQAVKSGPLSTLKTMVSSLGGSGITCQKLTADSFKAYGNVIQSYGSAENAPQGVASQISLDGKTIKFHELSPVKNSYAAETGATTGISVFRCTVKDGMEKAKPWPVHLMERHPSTEQAFIPMGIAEWTDKAEEPLDGGAAYVIIVADSGSDDRPDPATIKAFFCTADQGVNYHAGVWHHPMLTVGGSIDFACVEAQIGHRADPRDCELIEYDSAIGVVDIPDF